MDDIVSALSWSNTGLFFLVVFAIWAVVLLHKINHKLSLINKSGDSSDRIYETDKLL